MLPSLTTQISHQHMLENQVNNTVRSLHDVSVTEIMHSCVNRLNRTYDSKDFKLTFEQH